MTLIKHGMGDNYAEQRIKDGHKEDKYRDLANMRDVKIPGTEFGRFEDYEPTRDYILIGRAMQEKLSSIVIPGKESFLGGKPYSIVLKVGPEVKTLMPGDVVDFSTMFQLEMEAARSGVRPNTVLHVVRIEGHDYGLVSAGHVIGIRGKVNLAEVEGKGRKGDYIYCDYHRHLAIYAQDKEHYKSGKIKTYAHIFER